MGSHNSDSLERDRLHKSISSNSSGIRNEKDHDNREEDDDNKRKQHREGDDDDDEERRESSRQRHHHRRHQRRDDDKSSKERNKKRRKRDSSVSSDDSGTDSEKDNDDDARDRHRRRRHNKSSKKKEKKHKSRRRKDSRHKKRKKKDYSPSSSSSSSDSSSSESEDNHRTTKKVVNQKLLAKLAARGESLEEWRERKAQKRAQKIQAQFGYTAEENPFNDANLHETFTWKKKEEKAALNKEAPADKKNVFEEIEKVRKRRRDRELQFEEMERIRAEESRMKELENYDEWARKEEEFHLNQQRQRSAIRLVEGREKPIDVLAKNLLLFGLSEEDRTARGSVKYQERYNALNALEALEAELEEPQNLLKELKKAELEELLVDIQAFTSLEREASAGQVGLQDDHNNSVLRYWDALKIVAEDEIQYLKTGGKDGSHAKMVADVQSIFQGQSYSDLTQMKLEVEKKLRDYATSGVGFGVEETQNRDYWKTVLEQLVVHLAKMELSEFHSKMLVRQLDKLELKKEELSKRTAEETNDDAAQAGEATAGDTDQRQMVPTNVAPNFGNLEEELGLTDEIDVHAQSYSWQDKYRPRKPRYFNRVKTGYDWNKYNQTHYDHDNPPPKTVQGYKFNIFYPDLIDPTRTPQYFLEPADSDEFCILRFHAGPPYEDVAFKIINREWNRSRKRGFRSTFERGVLSLYFNFATHWYRR